MKKNLLLCAVFTIAASLIANSIYAQEQPVEYKQLIAKCGKALKQAKSYCAKVEYKSSFTISSQENKANSAELNIAFMSPDRFKAAQIIDEGKGERLWDGWIIIGNNYYVFLPVIGWKKDNNDNRIKTCKAYSPEGIMEQLEGIEKAYKRDSIRIATKDGTEYFVIKYLFGNESVNMEYLPPELRYSKINGTCEIWINENSYLPLQQSSEVSYYLNEQNGGISSVSTKYFSYNDDKMKISEPVMGSKDF